MRKAKMRAAERQRASQKMRATQKARKKAARLARRAS